MLSLETSDSEFVSNQLDLWIKSSSDYAKKHKISACKELINKQIQEQEEITQQNIDAQMVKLAELPEEEHQDEVMPSEIDVTNSSNESNESLDIFYSPVQETPEEPSNSVESKENSEGVFDTILNKSMKNPTTELSFKPSPMVKKDSAFLNFITAKKIEKKIDYLLLTAYYFTQYEGKPRFTLKQLNAKLMQNIAVIVDHAVVQEAINRDYIECLPDLTGVVGASEYRLTAYGEKTLLEE